MKYKEQIDPELKQIAKKVPYNKLIIKFANLFQVISFQLTKIPQGIRHRSILLKGHKGLNFKTEIFEPSKGKEKLPCLIYVHGGAFSYKASAYHKKLAWLYAMEANCRVYFPDYHLTPKYIYPAAYDDVAALYRFIMENSEELGIDYEKIGVAGDSAGASIAALICNNYEQEKLQQPCLQMLVYPVIDGKMQTDSMKKYSDTPLWNSKNNKVMWLYYCKQLKGKAIINASPMYSSFPQSIPNTYIETAEYDCLHDEGIIYGKRLQEAGTKVEFNETKGTFHGYDSAVNTNIAVRNFKKRILFLKKGFNHDSAF